MSTLPRFAIQLRFDFDGWSCPKDASGAVDNCTLPNVLNKMVRLVQSSLEPIPNGARQAHDIL